MVALVFNARDHIPLQPEDVELEYQRRADPRWAHLYRNKENEPTTYTYADWKAACGQMDKETQDARVAWRNAELEVGIKIKELHLAVEHLKAEYKRLSNRTKPPQPRSK